MFGVASKVEGKSLKVNLILTLNANVYWLSDRASWTLIIQIEKVAISPWIELQF